MAVTRGRFDYHLVEPPDYRRQIARPSHGRFGVESGRRFRPRLADAVSGYSVFRGLRHDLDWLPWFVGDCAVAVTILSTNPTQVRLWIGTSVKEDDVRSALFREAPLELFSFSSLRPC